MPFQSGEVVFDGKHCPLCGAVLIELEFPIRGGKMKVFPDHYVDTSHLHNSPNISLVCPLGGQPVFHKANLNLGGTHEFVSLTHRVFYISSIYARGVSDGLTDELEDIFTALEGVKEVSFLINGLRIVAYAEGTEEEQRKKYEALVRTTIHRVYRKVENRRLPKPAPWLDIIY